MVADDTVTSRTRSFLVDEKVFKLIDKLRVVVVVARGLKCNPDSVQKAQELLKKVWGQCTDAFASYPNVQSHPYIKCWRDCFQKLGVSAKKYTSSVESLSRRAIKQTEPRSINPVVDLYNAISLRYVLPFGAFDIDQLPVDLPMELRHTKSGDTFMALDETEPQAVPVNEVAYAIGSEIITRHINWKQSKAGLVETTSENIVFMSEILGSVPDDVVQNMITDLTEAVRNIFSASCQVAIVDSESPVVHYG